MCADYIGKGATADGEGPEHSCSAEMCNRVTLLFRHVLQSPCLAKHSVQEAEASPCIQCISLQLQLFFKYSITVTLQFSVLSVCGSGCVWVCVHT